MNLQSLFAFIFFHQHGFETLEKQEKISPFKVEKTCKLGHSEVSSMRSHLVSFPGVDA
jgi:hypothetical protein